MTSDIAPRLARNSIYYAIKSVVALAAMLLVTPYVLNTVGKAQYGVWALVGVLTSYAQLSDFGITESLVKYASEYHEKREIINLNRLVNTALVFLLMLAGVIGGIIILILPFITRDILNIPPDFQAEALIIFRLAVLIFLVNMVLGVFMTLIISSQQIGYTCFINVSSTVVGVVGTITFLKMGWGLRGLVATNCIVAAFTGMLSVFFAFRLFPELRLGFRKWVDRPMFRQIFTFSWKVQTTSISQLLIFQIDRILLSRYLGLEAVAYYEIGSNIAFYAKTFLNVLFAPLVPAVSALQASNGHAMISGLYLRSFKFLVMLAIPFCLLAAALADPFIRMWMGDGFALSALTLQLLLPAYLLNILIGPGVFILNGMARPEIAMRAAVTAGLLNLLLCFVLVKTIGYFGLILGITISLVVSTLYFTSMFHRILPEVSWSMYPDALLKPVICSIPSALLLYGADRYLDLGNIGSLIAATFIYAVLVLTALLKTSYLDDFEKRIFLGVIPFRNGARRQ